MNKPTDFNEMRKIANQWIDLCERKDKQYGSSWRKRGGVGAFFALIRKMDRFEQQASQVGYDVFSTSIDPADAVENFEDTCGDIINFLLLILEARQAQQKAGQVQIETNSQMDVYITNQTTVPTGLTTITSNNPVPD